MDYIKGKKIRQRLPRLQCVKDSGVVGKEAAGERAGSCPAAGYSGLSHGQSWVHEKTGSQQEAGFLRSVVFDYSSRCTQHGAVLGYPNTTIPYLPSAVRYEDSGNLHSKWIPRIRVR